MSGTMDWTLNWYSLQPVIILLAAVFTAQRIKPAFHPSLLLNHFLQAIANKVNHPNRSVQQRRIAGIMALLCLLVFMLVLLKITEFIVIEAIAFEYLILVCLLQWQRLQTPQLDLGVLEKTDLIAQLRPRILRDAEQLSILGLYKASIENLCLRNAYQWFAVVFWYICGGIWAAAGYRVVQIAAQQWNCKNSRFNHFGQAAASTLQLIALPVHWLLALTLLVQQAASNKIAANYRLAYAQSQHWQPHASGLLLACFAHSLGLQLGGPRKYQGQMWRNNQLGTSTPPGQIDMRRAQQRLQRAQLIWLLTLLGGYLLYACY